MLTNFPLIFQTKNLTKICGECKLIIVNFYNLKQKVEKNLDPPNKAHSKIIKKVRKFLDETNEEMVMINGNNSLSIVPASSLIEVVNIVATESDDDGKHQVMTTNESLRTKNKRTNEESVDEQITSLAKR